MAISRRLRFEILRRDGHTCRYCGAKAPDVVLEVDHVVPVTLGGSDDPANLVAACEACNRGKSSIPADAEIVEDVERDALRWKVAMERAVELHQLERALMAEQLEQFEDAWNRWGHSIERMEVVYLPDDPVTDPLHLAWRQAAGVYMNLYARPIDLTDGVLSVQIADGMRTEIRSELKTKRFKATMTKAFGVPVIDYAVVAGFAGRISSVPEPVTEVVKERVTVPLPDDWHRSIERFLSLGLPMDDLLGFVNQTMSSKYVRDEFGYLCKCAWNTISNLQEDARRLIESEDAE